MKSRTTLILFLAVAVVAGLVVLDYYKGTPTAEAETKRKRLLDFTATDITGLELVRSNQTISMAKSGQQWEIKEPVSARGNAGAINSMLDALEFSEREKTLPAKEIAGMPAAEFGLDQPRLRITLRGKQIQQTLALGAETPTKDAVYMQVAGKKDVLVVQKSVAERLDKQLDDLRERILMDFFPANAARLEIKSADRLIELVKSAATTDAEPRWTISRPLMARADQAKVAGLLGELSGLRAQDFLSESPQDVHVYQLDEPEHEITVWTGETSKTVLLSRALTNDAGKVCAKVKSADSIVTVPAAAAQKFALQVNDLRDARILNFREADVRGIEFIRGSAQFELALGANNLWRVTGPTPMPAEEAEVRGLISRLSELTAAQFLADVASDLDKFGLAEPSTSITLRGEGTNVLAQLLIGSLDETQALYRVKRADEPFIYGVGTAIAGWLPATALDLRERRVSELQPDKVTRMTFEKPAGRIVLERAEDGNWRMVEPTHGAFDNDGLQRLLVAFAQLRAEKFVRQDFENAGEYGLDNPERSLTGVAGGKTYTLALGKQFADGSRYASWSEPPLVFTISHETATALSKDVALVARPANSTPKPSETPQPSP
jgi:hypothetical protein